MEDESMTTLYTAKIMLPGFNAPTKMYFATVEDRRRFCQMNPSARCGRKPELANRDNVTRTQMNIQFYGLAA